MAERLVYILVLYVAGSANQAFVQIALSADMYYLKLREELRQNTAHCVVDSNRTKASSDDKDDRPVCGQTGVLQTRKTITGQQLLTNR